MTEARKLVAEACGRGFAGGLFCTVVVLSQMFFGVSASAGD